MTNKELAKRIRESIRTEETSVRLYYRHIRSVVLRSGLPENLREEFRETIDRIGQDDLMHRAALEKMLSDLGEADDDW